MPNITLSKKQQSFLSHVNKGENVFLTGKAGTGKSYVVKSAIQLLQNNGKNVVAIAPTGVAANNIGGQTIHSMFSLRPYGVLDYACCNFLKTEKRRLMNKIDVIFIDEVSMLRPDILDGIHWTLKKNGCKGLDQIQIIFIGDMKQLESSIDDNTRSVLLSVYNGVEFWFSETYQRLNVKTVELDEILRQSDEDFIEALNHIRDGKKHEYFRQFQNLPQKGIVLAPHNATVAQYNIDGLNQLPGNEITFHAEVEGNVKAGDFNLETTITVKNGAKIMYLANSKNNPLINGTLGIFKAIGDSYFITVDNVDYHLDRVKFTKIEYVLSRDGKRLELQEIGSIEQYPIKLAYALTIHKSQGLTFDEITLDLSLPCFSRGQMYTALSRVKTPQGLTIITK
ncbi:MAG TPA: DEAD/DEAH box helicase [Bacteroidia bacterium]|nr:DEAD/DEAH box helicase [Bacteroidia bacterium]